MLTLVPTVLTLQHPIHAKQFFISPHKNKAPDKTLQGPRPFEHEDQHTFLLFPTVKLQRCSSHHASSSDSTPSNLRLPSSPNLHTARNSSANPLIHFITEFTCYSLPWNIQTQSPCIPKLNASIVTSLRNCSDPQAATSFTKPCIPPPFIAFIPLPFKHLQLAQLSLHPFYCILRFWNKETPCSETKTMQSLHACYILFPPIVRELLSRFHQTWKPRPSHAKVHLLHVLNPTLISSAIPLQYTRFSHATVQ